MESIEVMQEKDQRIGYYSEDLTNRYLLKAVVNEQANQNIVIIMMNPKNIDNTVEDTILENALTYFTEHYNDEIKEINFVNLFPFKEDRMEVLEDYLTGRVMHKLMSIKYNLHMIKLVIKKVDAIYLAWGNQPANFSLEHFQIAVKDIYHLIRVFNKENHCHIFELLNHENLLNMSGTPFHPEQGKIIGTKKIDKMWIENNELKLTINDSLF